ncbi:hypothetical protein LINGRAHAP2_LOCUS14517 [Linum grandiflorum]
MFFVECRIKAPFRIGVKPSPGSCSNTLPIQHKQVAGKITQPKRVQGPLGMDLEKAKAVQERIDDYVKRMSELLLVERDAEVEFTQEELNVVPTPDKTSDSSGPIEFLVTHGQAQQEICDTICNLYAVSSSTGLGGMNLVSFRIDGNHRLPPTNLTPGDMVCVRTCDSKGTVETSCLQGFIHNLGDDGCSISVALESRHGDATFSRLSGKSVRIDRIQGLADTLTYEVPKLLYVNPCFIFSHICNMLFARIDYFCVFTRPCLLSYYDPNLSV